jgi:hypothetical protein
VLWDRRESTSGPVPIVRKSLLTGAGVLAVAVAAAGIYAAAGEPLPHALNTGPLGGSDYSVTGTCIPAQPTGSLLTDGQNAIRNPAVKVVVIRSISLVNPRGMKLLRAYVVLVTPNTKGVSFLHGVLPGVPPADDFRPDHYPWYRHQPAIGARIPHYRDLRWSTNLVIIIRKTGSVASYRGVNVYYSAGSQNYHLQVPAAVTIAPARCQ